MLRTRTRFLAAVAVGALCAIAAPASAQAWHYPAMQPASPESKEINVMIAGFGGDYGESFIGQYRFIADKRTQVWFDLGLSTPTSTTLFDIGAAGGWMIMEPTAEKPIDLMLTAGIYGAFGDGSIWRIPIGLNVGHTWILDNKHTLKAFAFPRASIDFCGSGCDTNVNLNFDLGATYDFTKEMIGRAAFTFGAVANGDSDAGFGISLAFKTK
jgi:hypothetical protein